jgi:hypothetical protein
MLKMPGAPDLPQQDCPECLGDTRPPLCPICGDRGEIRAAIACASCGRTIDPITEAAYSCTDHADWHCADCHFGDPHAALASQEKGGRTSPVTK